MKTETITRNGALHGAGKRPLFFTERRLIRSNHILATALEERETELSDAYRTIRRQRLELFGIRLLAATLRLAWQDRKFSRSRGFEITHERNCSVFRMDRAHPCDCVARIPR